MGKQNSIPILRFPEFADTWELKKLGETCIIKTGSKDTQNKIEEGLYPFYVRSDKVERINSFSYDGEAILTSGDGVGVGRNFHYINGKFDFHQRVYCLREFNKKYSGKFIFYFFSEKFYDRVIRLSAKNSVDSIRMDMISKMDIHLPSIPEQTHIATFLSAVDDKLTQLKKKKTLLEQYKKGVMQKIFSQELRFKDEKGKYFPEWIRKTLGEVVERIGDGLHGTPTYTESTGFYFINGNNLINGSIVINETTKEIDLGTYNQNRKGLNENTLLISINGTIGNVAIYQNEKVMLGKSVGYFNFKENINFYYYLLNSENVQNYFISELTGSTIKNLSLKTLRETEFLLPSTPEQTKIANFLSAIDEKINHCNTQIEKTEKWKKGLLQKMFV